MNSHTSEVLKIWNHFSNEKTWRDFTLDYQLHKKLFLAFQPGPYYYWILNTAIPNFEMVSPEVEKVLGWQPDEVTFPFLFNKVHPEDMPSLLNFETTLADFFSQLPNEKRFSYKIQYDFRLQKADGTYVRILNQMVMVQFDKGNNLIRTFGVHTDISHLKKEPTPTLSFIALNNDDSSYYDVPAINTYHPVKSFFSRREKEVLALMLEGLISKEICERLNISKHTVDSHRKHLLEKTESRSIPEMVKKAIINGWI